MRREERVTVQGPVKEQQPDGMSHRGALGAPSTISGKELPGLAVSVLAPLWSLWSSATPGRSQALAQKPAVVLGMVPARGREPGTTVIS